MTSFWEILKSSKNLKASDAFAELWGKSIADSRDIITITGALPLTFEAKGEALTDYRIYGTASGAGVETENLWDGTYEKCYFDYNDGKFYSPDNTTISAIVACSPSTTYTIRKVEAIGNRLRIGCFSSYPTNGDTGQTLYVSESGTDTLATVTTSNDASYLVIFVDYRYSGGVGGQLNVVPGSTAPASYIPPGYQLPLTLTSGQNTDTYPVYIGDTKLYEDEYVDYQEQKVYKRTEQLIERIVQGSYETDGYTTQYKQAATTYSDIFEAGTYTIKIANNIVGVLFVRKLNNGKFVSNILHQQVADDTFTSTFTLSETSECCFQFNRKASAFYTEAAIEILNSTITLVQGSTAPQYIPYLQPTDPPAPLPAITAYKGENTLSSEETVGEVSVTGKIKEI